MLDWTADEWAELGKTIGYILLSFGFFRGLQFLVRWYLFGKCTFRTFSYFRRKVWRGRPVPDSLSLDLEIVPPNKKWRTSNEVVSLIHSVISGAWALYACVSVPKLISQMETFVYNSDNALVLVSLVYLSFGYIIHDLIDLLVNERSARIIELLFHHVIVIVAFLVTLISHQFLGVLMFGLLMELNSIFLHIRSLMNLYGVSKKSTNFKFVKLLNIMSFAVFRIAVCCYLIYWWLFKIAIGVDQTTSVAITLKLITFLVVAALTTINVILLYRVMAADGLLGKGHSRPSAPAEAIYQPSSTHQNEEDEEDSDEEEDEEQGAIVGSRKEDVENGRAGPPTTSTTA